MAYKHSTTAVGHIQAMHEMLGFIAGLATLGTPGYAGTGNGTMNNEKAVQASPTETWTITCTTGGGAGVAVFSVTGSVSGAQAAATSDVHYDNGLISFDIVAGATPWAVSDQFTIAATQAANYTSGEHWEILRRQGLDEVLYSSELGLYEAERVFYPSTADASEWRTADGLHLPCYIGMHSAEAVEVNRFAICGTDEGAGYSMNPRDFDLQYSDDGTTWITAESWIDQLFVTSPSGGAQTNYFLVATPPGKHHYWRIYITDNGGSTTRTAMRRLVFYETRNAAYNNVSEWEEVIFHGTGLAAQDDLYVGMQAYQIKTSDIYNLVVSAMTGFDNDQSFSGQPQDSGNMTFPLWNLGLEYWLTVNEQRIAAVAKVDTYYHSFYMGKFFPYNTPGQFPFNEVVGASGVDNWGSGSEHDHSYTSWTTPYKGARANFLLRNVSGSWVQPWAWPWQAGYTHRELEGEHPILPIVLGQASVGLFGQLDGVFYVSGFNAAAEDTITAGGKTYLVVHDIYRTGNADHFALLLE